MSKSGVAFIVRTQKIATDNRVRKEIGTLNNMGCEVSLIYSSDDFVDVNFGQRFVFKVRSLWSVSDKRNLIRYISIVFFTFSVVTRIALCKKLRDSEKFWVCDPMLFGVVLLLQAFNKEVIWDHHELPPSIVLRYSFLTRLYKAAYRGAFSVIHANKSRADWLSKALECSPKLEVIIPNYMSCSDFDVEVEVEALKNRTSEFVYLQNCLSFGRCGYEIFSALKESGYQVVYAGSVDKEYLEKLEADLKVSDFCVFLHFLSVPEMNWVLKRSAFTLIFYRNISFNNWFCDANRLYHAVSLGVKVCVGNNPTMKDVVDNIEY